MRLLQAAVVIVWAAAPASAQIVRLVDLNTAQIRALDRAKTVVLLPGGTLEEHGPYLPAFTDGILSERLTEELARAVVAKKPGWIAPIVAHVHGAPLHIGAIDDAGDFFHDAYGGRMVNLWGLLPVLSAWGNAMGANMSAAEKKEDGVSLHGGMDEHSLMLYLKPALVAPGYKRAPVVAGATMPESFEVAKKPGWPGYIGSPRLATAALGRKIWTAFAAAAVTHMLAVLEGADPAQYQRYADLLFKNPLYQQDWIGPATARDEELGARQRDWLARRQ